MRKLIFCLTLLCLLPSLSAHATVFGQVKGIVHDPQHRPIEAAHIDIRAAHSDFTASAETTQEGSFPTRAATRRLHRHRHQGRIQHPPARHYVASNTSSILHLELQVASVKDPSLSPASPTTATSTPSLRPRWSTASTSPTTPGADRTNSMAMITDYVPGAYMTHDMLHMRGGHQVSWLIDGVEIPNTNIAINLAAQIDPKDIDYLEVQRGSYSADVGDRTYGVFNVVPRTGFERNHQAELVLSAGNFLQTNDQINFGDHTEKFAYYASLNGNRSDYGLAPPVEQCCMTRPTATAALLRSSTTALRRTSSGSSRNSATISSRFPTIPIPTAIENQQYDSSGLRDTQDETDGVAAFTWLHTFSSTSYSRHRPSTTTTRADYQLAA